MSELDENSRLKLLRIARSAIVADLFGGPPVDMEETIGRLPPRGVFVTLRKFGALRGCIGTFTPEHGLAEAVRSMAAAAAHDPRFTNCPISAAELRDFHIEISVLSALERRSGPLDFELGRHGIYIRRGGRSGCFLPDVATERGWDRETFLSQCCQQKVGIDPLAWREPDTEVLVFSVEKFGDGAVRSSPMRM